MAADTAAGLQQAAAIQRTSVLARWAGAVALCLMVAVYACHVHETMERRLVVLEATVAAMQLELADYPTNAAAMGLEQPLRNKRDATSGQCSCPPGKRHINIRLYYNNTSTFTLGHSTPVTVRVVYTCY